MELTFMQIDERVKKLKRDANIMLESGVGEMLKVFKSNDDRKYFYGNILDLYQDYQDDLFEADVIEAFRYIIYDYLKDGGNSHYKDIVNAVKLHDSISFISELKYHDECIKFIKSYELSKIPEIIECLLRVIDSNYWSD